MDTITTRSDQKEASGTQPNTNEAQRAEPQRDVVPKWLQKVYDEKISGGFPAVRSSVAVDKFSRTPLVSDPMSRSI